MGVEKFIMNAHGVWIAIKLTNTLLTPGRPPSNANWVTLVTISLPELSSQFITLGGGPIYLMACTDSTSHLMWDGCITGVKKGWMFSRIICLMERHRKTWGTHYWRIHNHLWVIHFCHRMPHWQRTSNSTLRADNLGCLLTIREFKFGGRQSGTRRKLS